MLHNAIVKVLLAAVCFAVVASKAAPFNKFNPFEPHNELFPSDYFPDFNQLFPHDPYAAYLPPEEPDTVHEEKVFGEDVEGAIKLMNFESELSYPSKVKEMHTEFPYPPGNYKITKIVVVIKAIDDEAAFDVTIKEGGLNENHVLVQVLANNTQKLKCSAKIFGIPAENQ